MSATFVSFPFGHTRIRFPSCRSAAGGAPGGGVGPADVNTVKTRPRGSTDTPSAPTVNVPSLPPTEISPRATRDTLPWWTRAIDPVNPAQVWGSKHKVPALPASPTYSEWFPSASWRGLFEWATTTLYAGVAD